MGSPGRYIGMHVDVYWTRRMVIREVTCPHKSPMFRRKGAAWRERGHHADARDLGHVMMLVLEGVLPEVEQDVRHVVEAGSQHPHERPQQEEEWKLPRIELCSHEFTCFSGRSDEISC